ncbi:putative RNA-directed DNA polymerase, partial [Tanacetum coccineum]
YRKVVDVYIAFKKTKKDTRFGFVRFINFGHLKTFERHLKEILIGDSRLIINRAKIFKGENVVFPPSDFPPFTTGGVQKSKTTKTHLFHSFKEAVIGLKQQVSPQVKNIAIKEDGFIRARLERSWMGKAKNFHVLQHAWIILENNGLVDCNIKYCGGLSFLFEWNSREVDLESLEANKIWLQQWFDDIKTWEEDDNDIGRLTWLNIEGLPSLVLNEFGRVLEIGRLYFDSKLLLPIKALVLLRNMNDIGKPTLNGKSYPIRIYEERFNVTTLITPSSSSDDGSSFEDEFVGPSMDLGGGDADFSEENLFVFRDNEKTFHAKSPCNVFVDSRSESFKEDNSHGVNINECVKPTPNLDVSGPNEVEENAKSLPDLGVSINKEIHGDQEDKELEDLFYSFQRLSEGANFDKQNKGDKKKFKHKKKKLVVGGCSSHMGAMSQMTNDVPSDDDAATKFIGASGGILTMWDSRVFTMEQCFKDRNYLGVIGSWVGVTNKIGLLNIYAPQPGPLKELLWLSLKSLMNSTNVTWVMFGDFNVVRTRDEQDDSLDLKKMVEEQVNLIDSLYHSFFDTWKDASVSVLSRSHSDHCPIMLKSGSLNFGPKPYKVFNKWIGNADFNKLVYNSWGGFSSSTRPNLCLKDKLKSLRLVIKYWTTDRIAAQNNAKEVMKSNLLEWDAKSENGLLNNNDILKREEWMMDLNHLEQLHRDDLKQKGRVRWAVEGDENSRFFHSILSNKFANFTMKGIHVNGVWVESPNEVKKAALEHFSSRFKEIAISRPSFNNNLFRKLSSHKADFLESNISLEEVKNWSGVVMGQRPQAQTGRLINGCNPSFTVLIPKKKDPLGFSDFHPISLNGCVYKVISKILATRLAKVINSIIGPNQSAFIEGRKILDGCLIANEVIRMVTFEKHKLLIFKVDFEKAFDSVNWNFLTDVMRKMGFRAKWRNWISSCLSSATILVMINGSPSKEFKMERGLRQGDPLSPFLFLLVVEALQTSIIEACCKGLFKGVSLAESGMNVSLL